MSLLSFSLPSSARAAAIALLGLSLSSAAQHTHAPAPPAAINNTVSVVMLSDLHVDPYHDPAKFPRLRTAGAAQWAAILAEPESATQAADFAKLNTGCGLRGTDSSSQLLTSALTASHTQSPDALFVTVSGDLMAHDFDCRFKTLAPTASAADYSLFAYKTVAYVALELRRVFGKTPVYVALGNNDSGCGDYRESSGSPFLRALAASLGGAFTAGPESTKLTQQFAENGGYSIPLPAPIVRGRLLVMQDLFLSKSYKSCDDKSDATAVSAQTDWLKVQLDHARAAHEQVWVMAHIPPGIDVYSTIRNKRDICGGQAPVMFLADNKLAEVLSGYSDIVRLAIFAHTHLDEIHLLRASDFKDGATGTVAIKQSLPSHPSTATCRPLPWQRSTPKPRT